MTTKPATDLIEELRAVVNHVGVTDPRSAATLRGVRDHIESLEAALATARADALEEAARFVETHVYVTSNFEPQFSMRPTPLARHDWHHQTIAAAIRALKEKTP